MDDAVPIFDPHDPEHRRTFYVFRTNVGDQLAESVAWAARDFGADAVRVGRRFEWGTPRLVHESKLGASPTIGDAGVYVRLDAWMPWFTRVNRVAEDIAVNAARQLLEPSERLDMDMRPFEPALRFFR